MLKRIKRMYLKRIKHLNSMEIKIIEWRKKGVCIGKNCHIYSNLPTTRDCFLLKIGDNVTISGNCTFLLHDSSINYPSNGKYTDLLGEIVVENNCFIGHSSIILPGVHLASGTIVGAGSVVTKSIFEPDTIIAGNPAKIISNTKHFFDKNKKCGFNLDGLSMDDMKILVEKNTDKLISK